MAEKLSPLDALEQKQLKDNEARRTATEAAVNEVRECKSLLAEAQQKLQRLEMEQLKASFDYEAERARLTAEAEADAKAKAA